MPAAVRTVFALAASLLAATRTSTSTRIDALATRSSALPTRLHAPHAGQSPLLPTTRQVAETLLQVALLFFAYPRTRRREGDAHTRAPDAQRRAPDVKNARETPPLHGRVERGRGVR